MVEDLTGKRFGKLTAIKFEQEINSKRTYKYWICKCVCGKELEILDSRLRNGTYQTCSCSRSENPINNHGLKHTKIYSVWSMIKQRCSNSNCKDYKHYGQRGIKICSEWETSVQNFYNWSISNGYKEGLSIDRIDVNGNYEPSNCRWIPLKEQAKNKRNNVFITYQGETHCLNDWSKITGLSKDVLRYRLKRQKDNNVIDYSYLFKSIV